MKNTELFEKIATSDLIQNVPPRYFSEKLAKENMWDFRYADYVHSEYKKFLYLAALYGNVSPSPHIDIAWHTHILHTKDYAKYCYSVLGTYLHHNPSTSKDSGVLYDDMYAKTIENYHLEFFNVDSQIWPTIKDTKGFVHAELQHNWVIPVGNIKELLKAAVSEIIYKIWK